MGMGEGTVVHSSLGQSLSLGAAPLWGDKSGTERDSTSPSLARF